MPHLIVNALIFVSIFVLVIYITIKNNQTKYEECVKLEQIDDTKEYRHNIIPKTLHNNLLMGTSSLQLDDMGYPLRLFIDKDLKGHWIDIPESDIRDDDIIIKLVYKGDEE